MPTALQVEIKGLREVQRKMEQAAREMHGAPVLEAVRDSALLVTGDAKRGLVGYESPTVGGVDSGRLRASITPEITQFGNEIQGVVGSNVSYAAWVEEDTRPHWPPIKALELWARRHHASAFLVARAISRRGTYGKHFLQNSVNKNTPKIKRLLDRAAKRITDKANS